MATLRRCDRCGAVWSAWWEKPCGDCGARLREITEEEQDRYVDEGHAVWAVWIPSAAWEVVDEVRHEMTVPVFVRKLDSRRWGRGRQVQVLATEQLADWLEGEAEFWSGQGVDPEARWRVRPCRAAAERIREVLG